MATTVANVEDTASFRDWEYERLGDYHRDLDPNWAYTPTYLGKMRHVRAFMKGIVPGSKVLDTCCGEGVLVDTYRHRGFDIVGLDLNYESERVTRGDVRDMPYPDESFDAVMFLDALEHVPLADQPGALKEIRRVLKPGGMMLLTVANLAHLNTRVRLLLKGQLDRTDIAVNHLGERPMHENEALIRGAGFEILKRSGVTLTVPYVYRGLICKHAARLRWLHDLLEPLGRLFPGGTMLNVFTCRKPAS